MIVNLQRIPINGKTLTFIGKEWETAAGFIDIYAKDDEENLYVIECKLSAAKDVAVAQTMRYMGAIRQETWTDKKIIGVLVSQGFEHHAKLAASAVPGFVLVDYTTEVLPFCQETVNLKGVEVPVHKKSFGYVHEDLVRVDIASDFGCDKFSGTVLKFYGDGIPTPVNLNLHGWYERRAFIDALRFTLNVLEEGEELAASRPSSIIDEGRPPMTILEELGVSPRRMTDKDEILRELGINPTDDVLRDLRVAN